MAEHSGRRSELYNEDEIPTAEPEQTHQRTIEDSGWWRAHFLVLASVVFGIFIGGGLLGVLRSTSVGSSLYWLSGRLLGIFALVCLLVFLGSAFATFFGYYIEAKILKQSNADWQPHWWLYVVATPLLSAIVISLIYLVNRERHVGIQWEQLAIWR